MASEFFRNFLSKSTCSSCNKIMTKGVIYDWVNQLPWCADCFKVFLEDPRTTSNAESDL